MSGPSVKGSEKMRFSSACAYGSSAPRQRHTLQNKPLPPAVCSQRPTWESRVVSILQAFNVWQWATARPGVPLQQVARCAQLFLLSSQSSIPQTLSAQTTPCNSCTTRFLITDLSVGSGFPDSIRMSIKVSSCSCCFSLCSSS